MINSCLCERYISTQPIVRTATKPICISCNKARFFNFQLEGENFKEVVTMAAAFKCMLVRPLKMPDYKKKKIDTSLKISGCHVSEFAIPF